MSCLDPLLGPSAPRPKPQSPLEARVLSEVAALNAGVVSSQAPLVRPAQYTGGIETFTVDASTLATAPLTITGKRYSFCISQLSLTLGNSTNFNGLPYLGATGGFYLTVSFDGGGTLQVSPGALIEMEYDTCTISAPAEIGYILRGTPMRIITTRVPNARYTELTNMEIFARELTSTTSAVAADIPVTAGAGVSTTGMNKANAFVTMTGFTSITGNLDVYFKADDLGTSWLATGITYPITTVTVFGGATPVMDVPPYGRVCFAQRNFAPIGNQLRIYACAWKA